MGDSELSEVGELVTVLDGGVRRWRGKTSTDTWRITRSANTRNCTQRDIIARVSVSSSELFFPFVGFAIMVEYGPTLEHDESLIC